MIKKLDDNRNLLSEAEKKCINFTHFDLDNTTIYKTTLMFFTVLMTHMPNFLWNIFQVAKPTIKAFVEILLKLDVITAYFKIINRYLTTLSVPKTKQLPIIVIYGIKQNFRRTPA